MNFISINGHIHVHNNIDGEYYDFHASLQLEEETKNVSVNSWDVKKRPSVIK